MNSYTRNLYGGGITARTPGNLIDAADLRQIPDNQEVFLYPDSSISIVVEILQRVEPSDFNDAIRFHFDSLAHDNSAASAIVYDITVIPNDRGDHTPSAIVLTGTQAVPKFNRSEPDQVHIFMALYRVEEKDIDLVVTFNVPTKTADGGEATLEALAQARRDFDDVVRSLIIVDYGLFA